MRLLDIIKLKHLYEAQDHDFGDNFNSLNLRRKDVQFSKTMLTDKHVQYIINEVSKVTNIPKADIEKKIDEDIKGIEEMRKYAPILYSTMAENAIEDSVFKLMRTHKVRIQGAPTLSERMFRKLVAYIKSQHNHFYNLKDVRTNKSLIEAIIFVPNEDFPQHNDVDTAAAMQNGTFIFNKAFCQALIDFAAIKGVRADDPKYQSNGGEIPDCYCYIEFLIIHEYMHYTNADWDLQKMYKIPNKLCNWVGDFRNNYELVKGGLPQLPMGLFSKDINYDQQVTFQEMIEIVKSEFDKLPKPLQAKVENWFAEKGDKHSDDDPEEDDGEIEEVEDEDEEDAIHPGSLVRTADGNLGIVTAVDINTKKVTVRDLTPEEAVIVKTVMSNMKKG
jgi:hypothetical protein